MMNNRFDTSRRSLLKGLALSPLTSLMPGLSLAATVSSKDARFVLVILRGAMDGLTAVQPYGDPALSGLRRTLLVDENQLNKLDSFFGLHPALQTFSDLYEKKELAVFHALASPYRERSHFDGQNVLETGSDTPDQGLSGWLNRAVPYLAKDDHTSVMGIGQTVPKVLDGTYETSSWAPAVLPEPTDNTIRALLQLYMGDSFLGERFSQGLAAKELAEEMSGDRQRRQNFSVLAGAAGKFLSSDNGPAVAVLEISGWDTHANQGAAQGQLANKLSELDSGMSSLKTTLGSRWSNTIILAVTEFGRTAAVNGTGGTDHGTAGVAFLLGGAVNGGRIVTDWPGLDPGNLYEGRDLRPTLDMLSLFAAVLDQHLGIDRDVIQTELLPGFNPSNWNDVAL